MTLYLVVAQGAGEYELDYSLTEYDADSPKEAADKAVADGYGQRRDGSLLFVCRMECVTRFSVDQKPTAYEASEAPRA